ncbi:MarR family transcriptional regulator [Oscillatoria laete-virens NRMC-F 0139]|nr:MarR family transcriptional regulator [Oscillatoria laete-virens]MDL5055401.1 MarR family transcriptional regulator [Oscillatoria laete-virens NRMC-F 0139]
MKELYTWQISSEELAIIKLALQGKLSKRSQYWAKAQAMAKQIQVELVPEPSKTGLTEDILQAFEKLGSATTKEIAEHLEVDSSSVAAITSKLYKQGKLKRDSLPDSPRTGRGMRSQYLYHLG